jgi:DNA-binding transcriptional MerR regulator
MDYFNIQVAAQVSGVSAHTIRAWEKRYQALVPKRSDNGRRQYTEDDINRLSLLSRLTNLGSSIGQIAHLEDEKLRKLLGKLAKGDEALMDTGSPLTSKADPESILRNILMGLALFKLDIISHELDKAQKELTPADLALKVIIPLFQEVGNKVQSGELNIAQEHSLSAITKFSIGQVIHRHYLKKSKISTKIVLATPEKEFHAIGILAAALLCCQHNYDLMYFWS